MTKEEAIKILRGAHDKALFSVRNALETLIPELAESDYERIRKYLIEELKAAKSVGELKFIVPQPTREECISYLEKQKEQKPKEDKDAIEPTPKQDYSGLTDFERAIHRGFLCAGVENVSVVLIKETAQDCLAQIKQKPAEWSEDDEDIIYSIRSFLIQAEQSERYGSIQIAQIEKCLNWLKSFRPQSHWKPSEEQMEAFEDALVELFYWHSREEVLPLKNLFDELKKL